jgi:hypothetical protein
MARIMKAVQPGSVIHTLNAGKPNRIVEIHAEGIYVQTERSKERGTGPRLVPASLIESDWEILTRTGRLASKDASHRGSFTAALFCQFPDVTVERDRPRVLRFRRETEPPPTGSGPRPSAPGHPNAAPTVPRDTPNPA